jgi:hypothetical protein
MIGKMIMGSDYVRPHDDDDDDNDDNGICTSLYISIVSLFLKRRKRNTHSSAELPSYLNAYVLLLPLPSPSRMGIQMCCPSTTLPTIIVACIVAVGDRVAWRRKFFPCAREVRMARRLKLREVNGVCGRPTAKARNVRGCGLGLTHPVSFVVCPKTDQSREHRRKMVVSCLRQKSPMRITKQDLKALGSNAGPAQNQRKRESNGAFGLLSHCHSAQAGLNFYRIGVFVMVRCLLCIYGPTGGPIFVMAPAVYAAPMTGANRLQIMSSSHRPARYRRVDLSIGPPR